MKTLKTLFPLVAAALLTGCATLAPEPMSLEQAEVLRSRLDKALDQEADISSVGYRILREIPSGKHKKFSAYPPFLYIGANEGVSQAYQKRLGAVMVTALVPGFMPEGTGLKRGDEVISFEGQAIKSELELNGLLEKNAWLDKARFGFQRGAETFELTLPLFTSRQMIFFNYHPTAMILAAALSPSNIQVSQGMLDFVQSDDELACVLGHELAHVTENHFADARMNALTTSLAAAFAGGAMQQVTGSSDTSLMQTMMNSAHSVGSEKEADRAGFQYAFEAGFDPLQAIAIWKRFSEMAPATNRYSFAMTHPTSKDRMAAMEKYPSQLTEERKQYLERLEQLKKNLPRDDSAAPLGAASARPEKSKLLRRALTTTHVKIGWVTADVGDEVLEFEPGIQRIFWFGDIDHPISLGSIKCRAEWTAPGGLVYANETFDCTSPWSSAALYLDDDELGPLKSGRWQLKVYYKEKLMDDRAFRVKAGAVSSAEAPAVIQKTAVTADPDKKFKSDLALALDQMMSGSSKDGAALIEKISQENPGRAEPHTELARFYIAQNLLNEAILAGEKAVTKNKKDAQAYSTLGLVYFKSGNKELAIENLKKASELEPESEKHLYNLGSIYFEEKKYEESGKVFERYAAAYPASIKGMIGLGMARAGSKDYPAARAAFQKVLELDPANRDAERMLKTLPAPAA